MTAPQQTLRKSRILLLIGGGIAAYKCLDLIRRLRERGASVRCVMTRAAQEFITPLSAHFCDTCNRVRLTATGTLYMCLGQDDAVDLRTPLRLSRNDALLHRAIEEAIARKPRGHEFVIEEGNTQGVLLRNMNVTGG